MVLELSSPDIVVWPLEFVPPVASVKLIPSPSIRSSKITFLNCSRFTASSSESASATCSILRSIPDTGCATSTALVLNLDSLIESLASLTPSSAICWILLSYEFNSLARIVPWELKSLWTSDVKRSKLIIALAVGAGAPLFVFKVIWVFPELNW